MLIDKALNVLRRINNPQNRLRILHIAGTNGKGSVCSYLSSVLRMQNSVERVGKFTSPHLVQITDSICINDTPISRDDYNLIEQQLRTYEEATLCSDFEILTCIAYQYFYEQKCTWCVVEVGLGGTDDATNVVDGNRKVCGITKIGHDHEVFLGKTLEEIAAHKAGIITKGVEFAAVDGSNDPKVIDVIKARCKLFGTHLHITDTEPDVDIIHTDTWGGIPVNSTPLKGQYQRSNMSVALAILDFLGRKGEIELQKDQLIEGLKRTNWPGRLQRLDFHYGKRKEEVVPLLLDGAHNGCAALELGHFLKNSYRDGKESSLCFVIAVTDGKVLDPLFRPLLRKGDHVIVTKFEPVERMPSVKPVEPIKLAQYVKEFTDDVYIKNDALEAVRFAAERFPEQKVVVCGSLYLVGHLLRRHLVNK